MDTQTAFEITSILYGRWVNYQTTVKAIEKERNDGSEDWELFHEERLTNAKRNVEHAHTLLEAFKSAHPVSTYNIL